jgi:hypothetical protein
MFGFGMLPDLTIRELLLHRLDRGFLIGSIVAYRRYQPCPRRGATLAAYRAAAGDGLVDRDEEVVLFNCATGLKFPMPEAQNWPD